MLLAWNDTMTTGTFVLVGVVIGAIIGAVVQALLEWRRGEAELRQAQRLISEDVMRVAIHYDGMAENKRTPLTLGGEAPFLPSGAWKEYRPVLARNWNKKRNDDYKTLSMFMGSLPVMRDLLGQEAAGAPLPEPLLANVERGRDLSRECYTILTGESIPWLGP
jgi:hypothetical protein